MELFVELHFIVLREHADQRFMTLTKHSMDMERRGGCSSVQSLSNQIALVTVKTRLHILAAPYKTVAIVIATSTPLKEVQCWR